MTKEKATNDSQRRLENMGINKRLVEKLLKFQEGREFLYDSAFKITNLQEGIFIEKVKDTITEQEAKDIYDKALARREFISRYIDNSREITQPHYQALHICNISNEVTEKSNSIIRNLQGER